MLFIIIFGKIIIIKEVIYVVKEDFLLFINPPTLSTNRLILREIKKSDLDDIFEYKSDPMVTEHLLYYPHKNKADTKGYINNTIKQYREGKMYDFAVVLKDTQKMIGTVGFTSINLQDNSAEIGYIFNRAYWGKGLAKEAVTELLDFGFRVLKLDRVFARIMAENSSSIRVVEKCGFTLKERIERGILAKGKYHNILIYELAENKL